jgi:hypothetical protein
MVVCQRFSTTGSRSAGSNGTQAREEGDGSFHQQLLIEGHHRDFMRWQINRIVS